MAHLKLETIIHSCNGWDPLKEVIVGDATGVRIPSFNLSMKNFMYANLSDNKIKSLVGSYDKQVIEETNEDLTKVKLLDENIIGR